MIAKYLTLTLSVGNSGSSMISRARNDLGSLDSVVFVVKKCVPPTFNLIQLFEQILPSS